MNKIQIVLLFLLPLTLLSACTPGGGDEPSAYGASTPAASDADARIAEAEARAAAAEAQLAQAQSGQQAPSQPAGSRSAASRSSTSGDSYTLPPAPGNYSGGVDATGLRQLCETYERTSVASFRGLVVCYNIVVDQHRDGSLQGRGYKSLEKVAGGAYRDLPQAEQSLIRVSGFIDNSDVIHLEYTVQGAQRATKGVASLDATKTVYDPNSGNSDFPGTFRSDAASASGSSRFTSVALRD